MTLDVQSSDVFYVAMTIWQSNLLPHGEAPICWSSSQDESPLKVTVGLLRISADVIDISLSRQLTSTSEHVFKEQPVSQPLGESYHVQSSLASALPLQHPCEQRFRLLCRA